MRPRMLTRLPKQMTTGAHRAPLFREM